MRSIDWDLGDGARIRNWSAEDAAEIYALVDRNRDHLDPWFPWVGSSKGPESHLAFIRSVQADEASADGNGLYVDGALVGGIGLSVHTLANGGEIGYWLDALYQGRGLVTRGCRAFLDFGFGDLGLHRIQITAAVHNDRSRAVAERLGLREEGVLRGAGRAGGGVYQDLVMYGILEDEWVGSAGA